MKNFLKVKLDDLNSEKNNTTYRQDFDLDTKKIEKTRNQDRKDLLHKVTHYLAFIILITFLICLGGQIIFRPNNIIMPDYFISIVSVVVGFYFAKAIDF